MTQSSGKGRDRSHKGNSRMSGMRKQSTGYSTNSKRGFSSNLVTNIKLNKGFQDRAHSGSQSPNIRMMRVSEGNSSRSPSPVPGSKVNKHRRLVKR